MTTIDALIERLRGMTGPDREVDQTIRAAFGWPPKPWDYTASVDAALSFTDRVLPGRWRDIINVAFSFTTWDHAGVFRQPAQQLAFLPVAILLATLAALQQTEAQT